MEQENTVEALTRVVHQQQLQIKALEQQIEILKTQIQSINKEDLLVSEKDENPPPHY